MVSDGFVLAFAERMAVAPDCCCQKRMASWSQPSATVPVPRPKPWGRPFPHSRAELAYP